MEDSQVLEILRDFIGTPAWKKVHELMEDEADAAKEKLTEPTLQQWETQYTRGIITGLRIDQMEFAIEKITERKNQDER